MIRRFNDIGHRYLDIDVEGWDGKFPSELSLDSVDILTDMLEAWGVEVKWIKRARLAKYCVILRIHIAGTTIYLAFYGMPSGIFLTTLINTLGHNLVECIIWILCCLWSGRTDMLSLLVKDQHVIGVKQGDDGLSVVSVDASSFYNNTTIIKGYAEIGLKATPPTKPMTDTIRPEYCALRDASFLKCNFKTNFPDETIISMAMDTNTIQELTNWTRNKGTREELLHANLLDAMRFAFAHGREYFEDLGQKIKKATDEIKHYAFHLPTFDDLYLSFMVKHGKGLTAA